LLASGDADLQYGKGGLRAKKRDVISIDLKKRGERRGYVCQEGGSSTGKRDPRQYSRKKFDYEKNNLFISGHEKCVANKTFFGGGSVVRGEENDRAGKNGPGHGQQAKTGGTLRKGLSGQSFVERGKGKGRIFSLLWGERIGLGNYY